MSRSIIIEGEAVEVKQHAKLSPSGAKRWMSCPGSIRLAEELGIEDKTSKYAAEGTVAHEVGELCLLNHKEPEEYLGQVIEADGFKFTVNQNMVDAVEQYVDYVYKQIADAETGADLCVELRVEVKCPLTDLGIEGLDGGTSDTLLVCREHQFIEVIDYKHGQGVAVEVEDNPQLLSYGLGALHELGIDDLDDWDVRMTIVQPRAHHPDGRIRSCTMNSSDLFEWQDTQLIPAALLTQDPDAPFKASDSACRFCKVAGQCRTLEQLTQETAMVDFADEEVPTLPDLNIMTAEQKTRIVEHADMLRGFIVAVENQVKLEVDGGSQEYADHFKLVRGKSNRRLNDDYNDEFNTLMEYLSEDDLFKKVSLPLGDIEALLKQKLGKVKDKKKLVSEIMEEVTTKPKGKLVIAPMSDKRMAVQPSIISDFENMD